VTIREALAAGKRQLNASPSPLLDARLLLQHVLEQDHSYLIAQSDQPLSLIQERQYQELMQRAANKEPIPYLIGSAPFCGRDFDVNSDVLIPRPETELLVETGLSWVKKTMRSPGNLFIIDVGTGSGCIAITLALGLPGAHVIGMDQSLAALKVAHENATKHDAGQVQFRQGELLEPVRGKPDLIVANLPYVADQEWTELDDGVKLHEPDVALRGGPDGLRLIRRLLVQATKQLAPGGAIFLEIGWKQGPAVQRLAKSNFPAADISVLPDYAGHDRIVGITYANKVIGR